MVDTETTGGASTDRLIEIGAVRVEAGRIVDRFEQLVDPGCAVPGRITRLTGITSAMVFDQPAACDVLPKFLDFLEDRVFVAHNLSFDMRFLNAECRRVRSQQIGNDALCTLRLARRLLPGLRSKGLSSLVDFYGIRCTRRHRALGDAEATAHVLLRFLDQLDLEYGLERLGEMLAFQYRRYSRLQQESKHLVRIREELLSRVPTLPGVYFMKNGRGRTIYVGKAQNLQARVRSYFTSIEGHPPRVRKMVKAVRDVEWEVTDSELEALLLESRLIKEAQPAYNRAQRRYVNRPFVRIDGSHAFPRVSVNAFVHDDGAEYYGPMGSRADAHFVVDLIDRFFKLRECNDTTFEQGRRCVYASTNRCTAPCDGGGSGYEAELDRVRDFLLGRDVSVRPRIEEAMLAAAGGLDYEQAAVWRDWIRRLDRLLEKREAVASRVLNHNAVVIYLPDARPGRLLLIRRGRHVETVALCDGLDGLLPALERHFGGDANGPGVYREQEVDELHLISHWLYVHRNDVRQVHHEDAETLPTLLGRVEAELRKSTWPSAAGRPRMRAERVAPRR